MAEFLLMCECGQIKMYQTHIKNTGNKKHWVIECKNCNKRVESTKSERAIEMWNSYDAFHPQKKEDK